ncbi:heme-binding protein [Xanthobacter dioxanivorans]|uniref:Heme-binding protein n=1 Tax=Xanthobacter dioxanivorans TaxID=2528964 RepID=A0A974PPS4_9HYPH|nr:heme-binding protein [Xanthobacter dioxanivorans]QRG07231.1 heme-binding protein [Xanthobacter dioxanivorans]
MRRRYAISFDEARKAEVAGLAEAARRGLRISIAVVDDAGFPLTLARMDEASPASVSTAIEKARTAALIGLPTRVIEDATQARLSLLSMDRIAVEGGMPLLYKGQRVGGIGVSGALPAADAEVAWVAADALSDAKDG